MAFNLKETISRRIGENYDLHEKYVNRTLVKVQRIIGFDKVYTRAKGCYLYDKDGNDYLDFLSGYGVYNMGRNHPVICQAIRDVLDMDLPNMVQMDCSILSGLLAEKLTSITGSDRNACFFCNSGTEANEGALKFARAATKRPRLLSLDHGYHGLSYGSLSITGNHNFQEGFGPYLPGAGNVKYGDLDDLEAQLSKRDVAGFIFEPVQGKTVYSPDDDYFVKAQELCRKYGTLFIADEVQTGLGRTGKMWGFEHWGLDPDIMTVAKALSGGYVPAAAIVTRRDIYQKTFSRMDRCVVHSTTFGRNNLAMACGLAAIDVIQSEGLVENSARRGAELKAKLQALQQKHDIIKEVRGRGCILAIEFQEPKSLKLKMAWKMIHAADKGLFPQMVVTPLLQKYRILAQVAGHNADVVKILPPLIIGEAEIDRFVNAFDSVLSEIGNITGPLWSFGANLVKQSLFARKEKEQGI